MQLDEILEENSIKAISKKTNISEENLEVLFNGEFDVLKKVKTMGFISIIEREYHANLKLLREQAMEYYSKNSEVSGIVLDAPMVEKKRGGSVLLRFMVFILLGIASWYFITQFDKEKLKGLLLFNEEKTVLIKDDADDDSELSIVNAIIGDKEEKSQKKSSMKSRTIE
jgi:cytoskeletal protein RodZ